MKPRKLNIGKKQFTRELEILASIFLLFIILVFSIYWGITSQNQNFDSRNQAAGKTVFLSNGQDLQAAIDAAGSNDAIFLRPGSYIPTSAQGFVIRNKTIRILGAGKDFTRVSAGTANYVFNITTSKVSLESLNITGSKSDGIKIDESASTTVTVKDSAITANAGAGIASGSNLIVQTSLIAENADGITSSGNLTVENTVIQKSTKNAISILTSSASTNTITNTLLTDNAGTAIAIDGGKSVVVKNVTASNNNNGIVESVATPITTITNSIVHKSKAEGIVLKNTSSSAKFTDSFQNATANYNPAALGTAEGNLSVDPGFISTTEFHLTSTSAVKAKGNGSEKNADGSRIDMGAFGGSPLILAANSIPKIESKPQEYVKPGEQYSYELKATDADGDALTYIALNPLPRWLTQDKNKFSGTPSRSDIGYFGVMVVVSDRRGGNVVQPISINVLPEGRVAPSSEPTPTPTQPQAVAPQVTITSPLSSTVFSKTSNTVSWTVNQGAQIESFEVKYSTDGQNFTSIAKLPGTATSYNWSDVEKVTNGKYFIRVEATDKGTPPVTVGTTSSQFEVKNAPIDTTDSITITKISPADNDVVGSLRQVIVVEFKPEVDLNKDETKLKINGQEVAYETTRQTIFYQPTTDYVGNNIQVEVNLVTAKGGKDSRVWSFNIQGTTNPNDTNPDVVTEQSICLPGSTSLCLPRTIGLGILACLILVLLLLILYFVVKFIKTLRDQREGTLEAEFTEYYDGGAVYPTQDTLDTTTHETYVQGSNVTETSAQPNEQIAANQDMSDYYTTETTTTTETQVQANDSQPQVVTNQSGQEQQYVDQQVYEQNQQPVATNADNSYYSDQSQTNYQQPADQTQMDYNQTGYQDMNDQNQMTPNGQMDQSTNNQQVDQTQGYNDGSQNQAQTAGTSESNNNEYIESLKKQYNVNDDSIQQYKENEQRSVDDFNNQQPGNQPTTPRNA